MVIEHTLENTGTKPIATQARVFALPGDRPTEKIVYWSIRSTVCPEPYIDVSAQPGRESKWKYTYIFYPLPAEM